MSRYLLISKTARFAPSIDDWYVAEYDTMTKKFADVEALLQGDYWNSSVDKSAERLQHLDETGELIIEHPKYSSNTWKETLTIIKL